ncbi:MAG: CAAX amino terminal protease self- immunity [Bacteroidetes bacterium ADurb.Bin123]|jgi:hypothetical protein|nr:MAG: CAAX amino terminal protease self- immunity [Bacteroidetes bacterium ADurb.Bin123]
MTGSPFTQFRDLKPFSALMFSAFIVLVVFLAVQFIAALVAIPFFGIGRVTSMLEGLNIDDPETIRLLKFFQTAQAIGLFIVPSFLVAWLLDGRVMRYLSLDRTAGAVSCILVILLVFVINPFINFTGSLNAEMHLPPFLGRLEEWMRTAEKNAEELTAAFLEVDGIGGLLFNLLMVAILPAFGEELLFRGVIQQQLTRWTRSHHWGIWLAAILFSALHLQFYGFIPRMLLGGMFGYLLVWSGSLWLPVLAHFVNNAGAVIALWMIDHDIIAPEIEEFGAGTEYWPYAAASLILGGIVLFTLRKQARDAS